MFDGLNEVISHPGTRDYDVTRLTTFGQASAVAVNILIGVGFSIGLVSVAYSAVMYVLSQGNPEKTKTAWNAFLWGVISMMVSIAIVALRNIIVGTVDISDPNIANELPNI